MTPQQPHLSPLHMRELLDWLDACGKDLAGRMIEHFANLDTYRDSDLATMRNFVGRNW